MGARDAWLRISQWLLGAQAVQCDNRTAIARRAMFGGGDRELRQCLTTRDYDDCWGALGASRSPQRACRRRGGWPAVWRCCSACRHDWARRAVAAFLLVTATLTAAAKITNAEERHHSWTRFERRQSGPGHSISSSSQICTLLRGLQVQENISPPRRVQKSATDFLPFHQFHGLLACY